MERSERFKTYTVESADFMLGGHEFRGEPVTGVYELNGKIHLFTANHTYVIRKLRWYQRIWRRLRAGMKRG